MPLLLVLGHLGGDGEVRPDEAIRVVHLGVLAQERLLAVLVGQVPADLVAVLFGLKEGDQVNAGPHFFATELTDFQKVSFFFFLSVSFELSWG